MTERINFQTHRLFILKLVLVLAFLTTIFPALALFREARTFPLDKVFDFWPTLPAPWDLVPLILFFGALILFGLLPFEKLAQNQYRIPVYGTLWVIGVYFILADQNRMLPWYHLYFLILLPFTLFKDARKNEEKILNLNRWVIVVFYVAAGLHKLNIKYIDDVIPWVIQPIIPSSLSEHWPPIILQSIALMSAIMETLLGPGLLFPKTRHLSLLILAVFHLSILYAVGPFGHNYAQSVWPWNLAMIAFAFTLFIQSKEVPWKNVLLGQKQFLFHRYFAVAITILPTLTFFGLTDAFFGFSIFSGNTQKAHFLIHQNVVERLPAAVKSQAEYYDQNYYTLDYNMWGIREYGASPIPEERNFVNLQKYFCHYSTDMKDVITIFFDKPDRFTGKTKQKVERCPAAGPGH